MKYEFPIFFPYLVLNKLFVWKLNILLFIVVWCACAMCIVHVYTCHRLIFVRSRFMFRIRCVVAFWSGCLFNLINIFSLCFERWNDHVYAFYYRCTHYILRSIICKSDYSKCVCVRLSVWICPEHIGVFKYKPLRLTWARSWVEHVVLIVLSIYYLLLYHIIYLFFFFLFFFSFVSLFH